MEQPNLGKRISKLRKAKGLTQEELAKKCKISTRTLQRIEAGAVTPRAYTVRVIFAVLNEDSSFMKFHFEHVYQNFKNLFNLKINTMTKLSIFSAAVIATGLELFALSSESKAQATIYKNHFQNTSRRGFQWFLPREKEFFSSHEYLRNDTLFITAGEHLIKEYNGNVFLNDQFAGRAFEGDTVILHKATLFRKTKLEFRQVEYVAKRLPNGSVYVIPKNPPPQMEFQVHMTEDENKFKIYLNGVDRGDVFVNDTVILRPRGTLTIKRHE